MGPAGLPLRPLPPHSLLHRTARRGAGRAAIRAALAAHLPPAGITAILHGDLWPGNTLWRAGVLAAVPDWEDAAVGDPLADVGNTCLELRFAGGEGAMRAFTAAYAAASGPDLAALDALGRGPDQGAATVGGSGNRVT